MAKLKKTHFYYGAILDALFQYNPDASPILILNDEESRKVYRVLTNTSKQECILFFKYASPRPQVKSETYFSWLFTFSQDDKEKLRSYYENNKLPIFIYLLGLKDNLKDCEIAILKYEEYQKVKENQSITIGVEKGKNNFMLFRAGPRARDLAYKIPRNRIERTFDELVEEVLKDIPQHYSIEKKHLSEKITFESLLFDQVMEYPNSPECPFCTNKLQMIHIYDRDKRLEARKCLSCNNFFLTKKYYNEIYEYNGRQKLKQNIFLMEYLVDSKQIKIKDDTLSILEVSSNQAEDKIVYIIKTDSMRCPLHNAKMEIKTLSFGKRMKDTVFFCKQCKKNIVSQNHYLQIKENRNYRDIRFEELI